LENYYKPNKQPSLRQVIQNILLDVDGILALRKGPGKLVAPYLFVKEHPEELVNLAFWPKHSIPDALKVILCTYPNAKLGIVCRGCEEPIIVDLFKSIQLNMDNMIFITLQCKQSEIEYCHCTLPLICSRQNSYEPASSWSSQFPTSKDFVYQPDWKRRLN